MLAKRYHFNATMTPFSKRTHGPECFTREFPATGKGSTLGVPRRRLIAKEDLADSQRFTGQVDT